MCGVVARLGKCPPSVLDEAKSRIAHRGTRMRTVETRVGSMAHARLPIVGLGEENDQPVGSSPWTIGFVGEILDYRETHPHLSSDVQLIPELWTYRPFEDNAFSSRDGFWGIAALNSNTDTIHILCDYLGQKPMYYRTDFPSAASEPAALLPFGPASWDEVYFSAVRKWGYCPDLRRTPWAEIHHVLPGEYVRIYFNGHCVHRIVDPLAPVSMSEPALRTEIEKATMRRVLSSDVPVAALVSGGLDSSIVYSLAAQHATVVPYHTSSTGFTTIEEEDKAMQLVRHSAEKLRVVDPTWGWDVAETADLVKALQLLQEPIDLGSLVPQYKLSKIVEQSVCLTGDGADELFGGYSRSLAYDSQHSDVFQELPAWHLPRLDRIMMGERIEVRSPFLARRVVQGALGLPWYRRRDKIALREMFRGWLPDQYVDAPKVAMKGRAVEKQSYRDHLISTFKTIFSGEFDRCRASA